MLGKANGGGIVAFLNVNCPNSSTITAVNGNNRLTATGKSASFKLPRTGNWTVTATYNGISQSQTVSVSAGQTKTVTLLTSVYLYNAGSYASGFSSGWSYGERSTYVETTGTQYGNNPSISNGSVNLNGYKHLYAVVQYRVDKAQYAWGGSEFSIIDASNTELAKQGHYDSTHSGWDTYQPAETWTFDITNINQIAKFKIATTYGSGGGDQSSANGGIILHSIRITTS